MELAVLIAITAGIFGLAGRLPEARKVKRLLARARVEPIDGLADGKQVVVRGTVAAIEDIGVLKSPLSKRSCVYWLITFDEVGTGGDYRELGRADAARPFLLVSEAGTARVVPERPRIATPPRSSMMPIYVLEPLPRPSNPEDASATEKDALSIGRDVCKRPNYFSSLLRITEYVVEPGMVVTVRGFCTREPDPEVPTNESGYRAALPTRPVISGTKRQRLVIG